MRMPKVVMFIDDDADDIDLFCEACGIFDNSIARISHASALDALQMLNKPDVIIPDFIFLDIYMPEMNGRECFIELKKIERIKHVPIIMCSVSTYVEDKDDCEKLGADFYLTKPDSMINMINSLLFVFAKYENKF